VKGRTPSLFVFLFSLAISQFASAAATPWKTNPHGQIRLLSADDTVPPSGEILLGLHFRPAPGWYVYWKYAGDSGYPPKVSWKGSSGLRSPNLLWPAPTRMILPGEIVEYGYEQEVVYPVRASLAGGNVHVEAEVSYLTCNTSCVPYKYALTLDLPSGGAAVVDPDASALIDRFLKEVPPASESDEALMKRIPTRRKNPGDEPTATGAPASLGWILILAFIGGIILNVMPCVLPVLSIKLLGLLQHAGQHRTKIVANAFASAGGIIASFLALAVAAILARRAGIAVGWGIQFQQPVFLGFLAFIIFLFALNLWGVFEIVVPSFIGHFARTYGWGESLASYFTSGIFATILATPCSAPFLGTAMGFALSQSAGTVLLIFASVGTGMAFPYFLLAAFPHSFHLLPKPGAWMGKLRIFMGALLAATALWLVSILLTQIGHPLWRPSPAASSSSIQWVPFDKARLNQLLKDGRSVFVDVTADWCVTCKYNERFVMNDSDVRQAFEKRHLVMMQADWTSHDATITAYLKEYGRAGIPFYALYRPGYPPVLLSEFLTKSKVLKELESIPP
jgi:thiol:disulfide interchange protein